MAYLTNEKIQFFFSGKNLTNYRIVAFASVQGLVFIFNTWRCEILHVKQQRVQLLSFDV